MFRIQTPPVSMRKFLKTYDSFEVFWHVIIECLLKNVRSIAKLFRSIFSLSTVIMTAKTLHLKCCAIPASGRIPFQCQIRATFST